MSLVPKSWTALQHLLVYLLGADNYNAAIDAGYTIQDPFRLLNDNITPLLQEGLNALVEDDRDILQGKVDRAFMIQNKFDHGLWWNNDSGWGSCSTADIFTFTERQTLNAPVEGVWFLVADLPNEIARLNGVVENLDNEIEHILKEF